MNQIQLPSPTQKLKSTLFDQHKVEVYIKRDDLIHSVISGNKWRKLKFNVDHAKSLAQECIITCGGAFSNHLIATAYAAKLCGLKSVGVVRGEKAESLSPTLKDAESYGMKLHFVSRSEYQKRSEKSFEENWLAQYPNSFWVPEGGANSLGVKGCEEILNEVKEDFDYVLCAAGTATTAAGILNQMKQGKLLMFPALKGGDGLRSDLLQKVKHPDLLQKLEVIGAYHFGGYARIKKELVDFTNEFYADFGIPLDLVYTAKMTYGFYDLLKQGFFDPYSKVLLIHTGGLQGNRGIEERYKVKLNFSSQ